MNKSQDHTPVELQEVAQHPFLAGLCEAHLEALASCAMRIHFNAGDLIFREGDPANRFYLLISGKVSIEVVEDNHPWCIQTIGGGDVLGWSWLFPPYYSHFDARALEPTDAMFFYGTRLREMCEEHHDLGYEMLMRISKTVIDRLVAAERQLLARMAA